MLVGKDSGVRKAAHKTTAVMTGGGGDYEFYLSEARRPVSVHPIATVVPVRARIVGDQGVR